MRFPPLSRYLVLILALLSRFLAFKLSLALLSRYLVVKLNLVSQVSGHDQCQPSVPHHKQVAAQLFPLLLFYSCFLLLFSIVLLVSHHKQIALSLANKTNLATNRGKCFFL